MNDHRGQGPRLKRGLCLALLLGISWSASGAWAGDRTAGRDKAAACQACHGLDGLSRRPDAPHISGQSAIYLRAQLRAYRSGKRTHEVMSVVARDLTDADIDDLTAHYSSIKVTVEVPE